MRETILNTNTTTYENDPIARAAFDAGGLSVTPIRRSKRVETGRVDAIVTDSRVFSKIMPTVALSDANAAVTNVGGGYIFGSGDIQSSRRRRVSYCKYV